MDQIIDEPSEEMDRIHEFFTATAADDLDTVKRILNEGLPPDTKIPERVGAVIGYESRYSDSATAVHVASRFGSINVFEYLYSLGVVIIYESTIFNTHDPLDIAVGYGHINIINFLINKIPVTIEREQILFTMSVISGYIDVAKFFLERKRININYKIEDIEPMLCHASKLHQLDMFNLLLEYGADVNDFSGEQFVITPLKTCIDFENTEGIKNMIRCGLDVNTSCAFHPSGIFYAALANDLVITELLLTNCLPNLEIYDEYGDTILHIMLNQRKEFAKSVIKLLLKFGAKLDFPNRGGETGWDMLKSKPEMKEFVMICIEDNKN